MDNRQDFVIGLILVVAVGVLLGTLLATSGFGERRYDLYLRAATAEGVTVDTRVILQGLEVGRVTRIVPRADSATRRVTFIARLSVLERFADGSALRLPIGTRAELVPVSQISSHKDVWLLLPDTVGRLGAMLEAGDTLTAVLRRTPLEAVSREAEDLSHELKRVLARTAETLDRLQTTLAHVDRAVGDMTPDVVTTVRSAASAIERVDSILGTVQRRGVPDSVAATVAATNRLVLRLDSLTSNANLMLTSHQDQVAETVANLTQASRRLDHFVDALSRRPTRFFTGVAPMPVDTTDSLRARNGSGRP